MGMKGQLGDDHELSCRALEYANEVIVGETWPLTPQHVDLSRVDFETSTRMKRRHGVCTGDGTGNCTVRLSERTYDRAGFESITETIRHELVHVYQRQTDGVEPGHGESFERWVEPLELSGRCSSQYETTPEDFSYRLYCRNGCGFVGGRYRWSAVVRRAIADRQVCGNCKSPLRVETDEGVLQTIPENRR